ncbi:PHP domain-containing protein [Agaribacter flavus]|uniref:PHP domain-containing protein n=1 Tax=Agaribacter flavus TaxID=1902781 RepID=A0ABV7FPU4_9ALTE
MRVKKRRLFPLVFVVVCLILAVDFSRSVEIPRGIQPEQVKQARGRIKALVSGLASTQGSIQMSISPDEAKALGVAASAILPNTTADIAFDWQAAHLKSSTAIVANSMYLNVSCKITLDFGESRLSYCFIGDLPIPGIVVSSFSYLTNAIVFDSEVAKTINNILSGWTYDQGNLRLFALKPGDFKDRVNQSIDSAKQVARVAISQSIPPAEKIQTYVASLESQSFPDDSLAYPIQHLSLLASVESLEGDPILENQALIWALALKYGGRRFAKMASLPPVEVEGKTLRGRRDLALHFIYSAILQQIGDNQISFAIGELKELYDTNAGGSGFSFADLAADKAGTLFADNLTKSKRHAIEMQNKMNGIQDESSFMPFIHDLPEGLSLSKFEQLFGSTESEYYIAFEDDILERVLALPIYADESQEKQISYSNKGMSLPFPRRGQYFVIDTHIHTRYSDGAYSIEDIAEQSSSFGCDAIAITDHGDKNLSGVLSNEWFADIDFARAKFPNLTIIPGLEWNIPPFNGREHATLLLPKNRDEKQNLRTFRNNFDHYGRINRQLISTEAAFNWLNDVSASSDISPVVVYNHPSRKDKDTSENYFDMLNWMSQSNALIGMSAAPGHQKKRGKDNGSYNSRIRTINGFDPATAVIGGEWDRLLQIGQRVLAARAASDFHNTSMDFWPCQFSRTHVFANSSAQNDILQGLRLGRTWAQHGNFVKHLAFYLSHQSSEYHSGQTVSVEALANSEMSVSIQLQKNDWQGLPATLDELQVIIVLKHRVTAVDLLPYVNKVGDELNVTLPLSQLLGVAADSLVALRLQGRSIQAELHDYMFLTNPIFIQGNEQ